MKHTPSLGHPRLHTGRTFLIRFIANLFSNMVRSAGIMLIALLFGGLLMGPTAARAASSNKLASGGDFPDPELPPAGEFAEYLGLVDPYIPFKLSQVDADVVLVEISSYFCGPCRTAVPDLNRIFNLTKRQSPIKVRLISIGAGDSPDMVAKFTEQLSVRYPLLPDMDLELHAALGSVPAPHTFVVRLPDNPEDTLKLLDQKSGQLEVSPEAFLDSIRAMAE